MADINVTEEIIEINVTEEAIVIEAPSGGYPLPASISSVFGRTGAVIATIGDYNTSLVTENTNLYFTNARARSAISLTTSGTSGAATYDSGTGVLNVPQYQGGVTSFNTRTGAISLTSADVSGALTYVPYNSSNPSGYITGITSGNVTTALGYTPVTNARTLTINGTTFDLTADRSWTITGAVSSVFGRTGVVVSTSGDYTTTQVTEGTNLYYTDVRARAALSFVAGSGAYNSTTGVITIPTNNNQITNGSNYITLTSLSGSTGISYNNTTGAISSTITQYTDALARASISLTTTGTSGAATYNSTTGVFNIPQYSGGGGGGTVTSVAALTLGTTGTDLSSSVANGTTTPVITLNVPTASAANRGALSSADWTTFNGKQSALTLTTTGTSGAATLVGTTLNIPQYSGGGGMAIGGSITSATAGSVLFAGASGVLQQDNANLFFDDTNNRLGIGSTTLGSSLQINGNAAIGYSASTAAPSNGLLVNTQVGIGTTAPVGLLHIYGGTGNGPAIFNIHSSGGGSGNSGIYFRPFHTSNEASLYPAQATILAVDNNYSSHILFSTKIEGASANALVERMRLTSTGNFGIATTTIGSTLQINGNAAIGYSASTAAPTNGLAVSGATTIGGDATISGVLRATVTTNRQTASYTLVLADRGKLVEMNVATANNLTIPLNATVAFPIGTQIDLSQYGAGQTTVVATSGVTIRSTNSWVKLNAQYAAATLIKIGTDEWYLFGNLNA